MSNHPLQGACHEVCRGGLHRGAVFAAPSAPGVQTKDGWIRWLPPSLPAGGYVILRNTDYKPLLLLGAESAACVNIMLHATRNKDISEIINMDKVTIPAHGTIAFRPSGYHIMLMQVKKQVKPGDIVPLTLQFEGGDELTVNSGVPTRMAAVWTA